MEPNSSIGSGLHELKFNIDTKINNAENKDINRFIFFYFFFIVIVTDDISPAITLIVLILDS